MPCYNELRKRKTPPWGIGGVLGGGLEFRVKLLIGWGTAPGFYIWDVN